jgi:hypothetical protein
VDIFTNLIFETERFAWFSCPDPDSKYDLKFAYYGLYDFGSIFTNQNHMIPKYALSDIKILQYDSVVTFIVYIFFSEYAAIYATTKTEDWTPDEDWYSINDIDDPEEQELEKENYYDWNYQPDIIV